VGTGQPVTLDGTGSTDADGNPLTFRWSFTFRPLGSTATLSGPTLSNPTFVPDKAGTYVAQLIVNDGTVDSAPATVGIAAQADSTPPDTTLTATPPAVSGSSVSFSFTATEAGSTFECRLDAGAFAACTSPKAYGALAQGAHTFRVRAKDPAGNVDPTPASYTWTVDTAPPDTTLTATPPAVSSSPNASFSFTATQVGSTFECKLDAGVFAACTSPKAYSGLAQGAHTFRVRAKDPAGNLDPTPASYTWTIDTAAPNTTLTATPPPVCNSASASFSFTATQAGSTFECKLDAGVFAACTSPKSYAALAQGAHTFQVRAKDPAGNLDPTPASYPWTVDTLPPNTTLLLSPRGLALGFSFTASEAGSTFECRLDWGRFAPCTSPQRAPDNLAEGPHTFQVRAKDPAGNLDPTPASHTWTEGVTMR
jgi:hypothetical protein